MAQLVKDRRAYHVFEELNTYTAVVYLKKVNHPAAGAPRRGIRRRDMATTDDSHARRTSVRTSRRRTFGFPRSRTTSRSIAKSVGTLHPTLGWFAALGIAIFCLLIGVGDVDVPDP